MKKITDNNLAIIYKLLNDILKISLFAWATLLLAENILPGFISSHLSFLKLAVVILLLVILISFLGRKLRFSFSEQTIKKWLLIIATLFFIVNITLSLYKFGWLNLVIIIIVSFLIVIYLCKLFFH